MAFYFTFATRLRMRGYWQRSCAGRAWAARFPTAHADDIRKFLHLFVDAFGFSRRRALQFAPTDQIMSVYRTVYPLKNMPDALELETFARDIKASYGLDLVGVWREDTTLGEIFAKAQASA